jgi:hypothetical protein
MLHDFNPIHAGRPGPPEPRVKIPWDEKTSPGPVPGPVEIKVPWDEAAARLIPNLRIPKGGKRDKPKR